MKSQNIKMGILLSMITIVVIAISTIAIFGMHKNPILLDDVNVTSSKKDNLLAFMLEQANGSYASQNTIPSSGYWYREGLSGCIDDNGQKIVNGLNYSNGSVTINTPSTAHCYLYFGLVRDYTVGYFSGWADDGIYNVSATSTNYHDACDGDYCTVLRSENSSSNPSQACMYIETQGDAGLICVTPNSYGDSDLEYQCGLNGIMGYYTKNDVYELCTESDAGALSGTMCFVYKGGVSICRSDDGWSCAVFKDGTSKCRLNTPYYDWGYFSGWGTTSTDYTEVIQNDLILRQTTANTSFISQTCGLINGYLICVGNERDPYTETDLEEQCFGIGTFEDDGASKTCTDGHVTCGVDDDDFTYCRTSEHECSLYHATGTCT